MYEVQVVVGLICSGFHHPSNQPNWIYSAIPGEQVSNTAIASIHLYVWYIHLALTILLEYEKFSRKVCPLKKSILVLGLPNWIYSAIPGEQVSNTAIASIHLYVWYIHLALTILLEYEKFSRKVCPLKKSILVLNQCMYQLHMPSVLFTVTPCTCTCTVIVCTHLHGCYVRVHLAGVVQN